MPFEANGPCPIGTSGAGRTRRFDDRNVDRGFYAVSSTSGDLDNLREDTTALYEISQVRTTYTQMRMELMIVVLSVVGQDAGAGFLLDDAVVRREAADDEFARLGMGLNETVETLALQASNLDATTNELHEASTALTHVSDGLSQNAAEVSSRTGEVAISVQAMSSHASSVSMAIEQMNESIREIAGRAAQATATSRNGTIEARNATEAVHSLEGATAAIQRAVAAIGSIAEQTNLLALDATKLDEFTAPLVSA